MHACVFFILFFACSSLHEIRAQIFVPGVSVYGAHGYTEYIPGTLPLIISAPHGGYLEPDIIPDRTCGDPVYANDAYTQELVRDIASALYDRTGCYPHIVVNLLDRRKLDANRNLFEGACGNDSAVQAWNDFNDFLDVAEDSVMAQFGKGFYIDLHGHGHTIQRLELGYLLYADELALDDATLNVDPYLGYSSVQKLVEENPAGYTHAELLRGAPALGTLLSQAGYPTVPSADDAFPAAGDPYFSGGYNTIERSSYSGGTIDGVQIECNMDGVRNTAANRARFADSLSAVLEQFLVEQYFPDGALALCAQVLGVTNAPLQQEITVYPNPATQEIMVHTTAAWIEVYDIRGGRMCAEPVHAGTCAVSVSDWPAGVYVVRMTGNGVFASVPFVKE